MKSTTGLTSNKYVPRVVLDKADCEEILSNLRENSDIYQMLSRTLDEARIKASEANQVMGTSGWEIGEVAP